MADLSDPTSLSSWLQTGGVIAFAGAVWMQLRKLEPFLDGLNKTMAALLERDRMRDAARAVTAPPVDEWEETTAVATPPKPKRRTPVGGTPVTGGYSHVRPFRGNPED